MKNKRTLFIKLICAFCTIFISLPSLAKLKLETSQTQLPLGDSFVLTITATDYDQLNQPSLAPLTKDFDIVGRRQSERISIINGHAEKSMQWILTLTPKRQGTLTIPSLNFGDQQSKAIQINVDTVQAPAEMHRRAATKHATSRQAVKRSPTVFLEVEATPLTALVQSQVIYRVRLYYSESISNGSLSNPSADKAVILNLQQDRNFQKQVNSRMYQVLERTYVIFPESSGELRIQGPVFSGLRTNTLSQGIHDFDVFFGADSKPIKLYAQSKTIKVDPIPKGLDADHWLPANKVELTEQLALPEQLEVGQPIARTVQLKVHGTTQAQLPAINQPAIKGVKLYKSTAQLSERAQRDTIIANKTQRFTYIASQPGKISLPAIRVNWWNQSNQTLETASLPAHQIQIRGTAVNQQQATTPLSTPKQTPTPSATQHTGTPFLIFSKLNNSTAWIAMLWLLTLVAWWAHARRQQQTSTLASEKKLFNTLLKTIKKQTPQSIEVALIAWAQCYFNQSNLRNLDDIVGLMDDLEVRSDIQRLAAACYGQQQWQASKFAENLKAFRKQRKPTAKKERLAQLYPTG